MFKDFIALLRGHLFKLTSVFNKADIRIGKNFLLYDKLQVCGQGTLIIGDDCIIKPIPGNRTHYTTFYFHEPYTLIEIGDRATIYAGRFSSAHGIAIGDDFIMEDACIMDTNFHAITPDRSLPKEKYEDSRIIIQDRVSLAVNSLVCRGTHIASDTKTIPGTIYTKSKMTQVKG